MNNVRFTYGGAPFLPAAMTKDEEIAQLRGQVRSLTEFLEGAQRAPAPLAAVLAIDEHRTTIVGGPGTIEIGTPKLESIRDKLRVGAMVHIDPKTSAIVDVADAPPLVGPPRLVERIVEPGLIEVEGGGRMLVRCDPDKPPAVGDVVMLDPMGFVVVKNLGPMPESGPQLVHVVKAIVGDRAELEINGGTVLMPFDGEPPAVGERVAVSSTARRRIVGRLGKPPLRETPPIETGVTWDDIGGNEQAKRELRDAIEVPVLHAETYKAFGRRRPKGALLCGPSGTGKTMLARAAATAVATLYGAKWAPSGFISVRGPEVLSKWVGESERQIRELFETARRHKSEHGYPAIIFFDEADGLLAKRGSGRFEGIERTIVPALLAEMDGLLDDGSAFVLCATNRPDMLDPAVVRDGRLDIKVHVRRPTQSEAIDICAKHLRGRPLVDIDHGQAAIRAAEELFAQRHVLYRLRTKSGKGDARFTLGDLASGAACAGLVERATEQAFRRALARPKDRDRGVTAADLAAAADELCAAQRALDHTADLREAVDKLGDDFRSLEKAS